MENSKFGAAGRFVKELKDLPMDKQEAIRSGLQAQIIAQAEFVRDEQPTKFVAYIDAEIEKADATMLKMIAESSREGAELSAISEIYIWNKERKAALTRLKDEHLQQHQETAPEPQQGNLSYYCQKAVERGLLERTETGYKRARITKAQLAYFLSYFLNDDGTFPDKRYSMMFVESQKNMR